MEYLLVIMFYLGSDQPQFVDGFLPITFETFEECEERRLFAEQQLRSNLSVPPFHLACYQQLASGSY